MSYYSMVSVVPFLVIIIVFAPARTAEQISLCPLQIPHFCGISHLLTCKSSLVEQGVRSPPNNLYYLNYYLTINPNDVWIIPTLYIVALDCIFTIAVGSVLKISAECIYICTNASKLPNSVNPITKLTSWLNSHCKMGPGHVQHILNCTHVKPLPKWAGNLFIL